MQPTITRETLLVNRRQPALRWTAIAAGAALAVGIWGVLQLVGLGVGLAALDSERLHSMRPGTFGTTAFSTLAPLVAMFAGGYIATRLVNTLDRRTAYMHALVTWGIGSVVALISLAFLAPNLPLAPASMTDSDMLVALDHMGKGMIALGVAMLMSLGTALLGALLALRNDLAVDRTTTAQYPAQDPV